MDSSNRDSSPAQLPANDSCTVKAPKFIRRLYGLLEVS